MKEILEIWNSWPGIRAHVRLLTTITLLTVCMAATGQSLSSEKDKSQKKFTNYSGTWLHTESKYTGPAGKDIIIQNSFPKGGGQYIDSGGKTYNYVIFWYRIMNETPSPLELEIKFPADQLAIFPSPESHLKLFLHPGEMTLEKEALFDYGITDLKSFLDASFNKPTMQQRTVNPGDECLFYVPVLFYRGQGSARTAFVLKEQDLFYQIKAGTADSGLIPCGRIVFRK